MRTLILADDLTGAADCATAFARCGYSALLAVESRMPRCGELADVVAVDTNTRHLCSDDAAELTLRTYNSLRLPDQRLYKKVDSTMRGNWAQEVGALRAVAGFPVVAPAFPAMGRTVRDGNVYVYGEKLEETETWLLECRGRASNLADQLRAAGMRAAVVDVSALAARDDSLSFYIKDAIDEGFQALVIDTRTDDGLRSLACQTMERDVPFFWVGSGGLARELATAERPSASRPVEFRARASRRGPVLVVVGSISAVSDRQCAKLLKGSHMRVLEIRPELLTEGPTHPDWNQHRDFGAETMQAGCDLLVTIARGSEVNSVSSKLSQQLARLVEPALRLSGGVIATGGDTARAVAVVAGLHTLQVIGEVETGINVLLARTDEQESTLRLITKAGAFGTDSALLDAWTYLRANANLECVSGNC
ncbi:MULTISPECIES: four-carbon acid sugar kinase family protein [unclassified Caballeronia]|uniref:four-carbon acid sugar kinase family protein n=1 Tax=unclassified Caballeronia TaxID=2646786 RepID=UPI00202973A3|nr:MULTISPECIES: four-carbon acid sugar kinase family protein [unclassified Caballeronia]MDR5765864.1 four-carbon acid sugar kinase family protein [Caballeronia sp. LZ028]